MFLNKTPASQEIKPVCAHTRTRELFPVISFFRVVTDPHSPATTPNDRHVCVYVLYVFVLAIVLFKLTTPKTGLLQGLI